MGSLRRLLPSLDHLEVFEVAGRLGSFSRAAIDLGISQAAISYAIRMLETDLGLQLFDRGRTGVRLTEAGARLHAEVSLALSHIRQSVEQTRRGRASAPVTLSVSMAFATFWMLPRLTELRRALPDVDLRLQTTDRDVDLRADGIDLGVRYGGGVLPHYARAPVAAEVIYAVCSPGYLASLPALPRCAEDLVGLKLIHLDEPNRQCPNWQDWFGAFAVAYADAGSSLRLNDYALCVMAALEGQGLVLGWAHLLDPLIAAGTLVRATPERWETGIDFMLVWSGELAESAKRVRAWLLERPSEKAPAAQQHLPEKAR